MVFGRFLGGDKSKGKDSGQERARELEFSDSDSEPAPSREHREQPRKARETRPPREDRDRTSPVDRRYSDRPSRRQDVESQSDKLPSDHYKDPRFDSQDMQDTQYRRPPRPDPSGITHSDSQGRTFSTGSYTYSYLTDSRLGYTDSQARSVAPTDGYVNSHTAATAEPSRRNEGSSVLQDKGAAAHQANDVHSPSTRPRRDREERPKTTRSDSRRHSHAETSQLADQEKNGRSERSKGTKKSQRTDKGLEKTVEEKPPLEWRHEVVYLRTHFWVPRPGEDPSAGDDGLIENHRYRKTHRRRGPETAIEADRKKGTKDEGKSDKEKGWFKCLRRKKEDKANPKSAPDSDGSYTSGSDSESDSDISAENYEIRPNRLSSDSARIGTHQHSTTNPKRLVDDNGEGSASSKSTSSATRESGLPPDLKTARDSHLLPKDELHHQAHHPRLNGTHELIIARLKICDSGPFSLIRVQPKPRERVLAWERLSGPAFVSSSQKAALKEEYGSQSGRLVVEGGVFLDKDAQRRMNLMAEKARQRARARYDLPVDAVEILSPIIVPVLDESIVSVDKSVVEAPLPKAINSAVSSASTTAPGRVAPLPPAPPKPLDTKRSAPTAPPVSASPSTNWSPYSQGPLPPMKEEENESEEALVKPRGPHMQEQDDGSWDERSTVSQMSEVSALRSQPRTLSAAAAAAAAAAMTASLKSARSVSSRGTREATRDTRSEIRAPPAQKTPSVSTAEALAMSHRQRSVSTRRSEVANGKRSLAIPPPVSSTAAGPSVGASNRTASIAPKKSVPALAQPIPPPPAPPVEAAPIVPPQSASSHRSTSAPANRSVPTEAKISSPKSSVVNIFDFLDEDQGAHPAAKPPPKVEARGPPPVAPSKVESVPRPNTRSGKMNPGHSPSMGSSQPPVAPTLPPQASAKLSSKPSSAMHSPAVTAILSSQDTVGWKDSKATASKPVYLATTDKARVAPASSMTEKKENSKLAPIPTVGAEGGQRHPQQTGAPPGANGHFDGQLIQNGGYPNHNGHIPAQSHHYPYPTNQQYQYPPNGLKADNQHQQYMFFNGQNANPQYGYQHPAYNQGVPYGHPQQQYQQQYANPQQPISNQPFAGPMEQTQPGLPRNAPIAPSHPSRASARSPLLSSISSLDTNREDPEHMPTVEKSVQPSVVRSPSTDSVRHVSSLSKSKKSPEMHMPVPGGGIGGQPPAWVSAFQQGTQKGLAIKEASQVNQPTHSLENTQSAILNTEPVLTENEVKTRRPSIVNPKADFSSLAGSISSVGEKEYDIGDANVGNGAAPPKAHQALRRSKKGSSLSTSDSRLLVDRGSPNGSVLRESNTETEKRGSPQRIFENDVKLVSSEPQKLTKGRLAMLVRATERKIRIEDAAVAKTREIEMDDIDEGPPLPLTPSMVSVASGNSGRMAGPTTRQQYDDKSLLKAPSKSDIANSRSSERSVKKVQAAAEDRPASSRKTENDRSLATDQTKLAGKSFFSWFTSPFAQDKEADELGEPVVTPNHPEQVAAAPVILDEVPGIKTGQDAASTPPKDEIGSIERSVVGIIGKPESLGHVSKELPFERVAPESPKDENDRSFPRNSPPAAEASVEVRPASPVNDQKKTPSSVVEPEESFPNEVDHATNFFFEVAGPVPQKDVAEPESNIKSIGGEDIFSDVREGSEPEHGSGDLSFQRGEPELVPVVHRSTEVEVPELVASEKAGSDNRATTPPVDTLAVDEMGHTDNLMETSSVIRVSSPKMENLSRKESDSQREIEEPALDMLSAPLQMREQSAVPEPVASEREADLLSQVDETAQTDLRQQAEEAETEAGQRALEIPAEGESDSAPDVAPDTVSKEAQSEEAPGNEDEPGAVPTHLQPSHSEVVNSIEVVESIPEPPQALSPTLAESAGSPLQAPTSIANTVISIPEEVDPVVKTLDSSAADATPEDMGNNEIHSQLDVDKTIPATMESEAVLITETPTEEVVPEQPTDGGKETVSEQVVENVQEEAHSQPEPETEPKAVERATVIEDVETPDSSAHQELTRTEEVHDVPLDDEIDIPEDRAGQNDVLISTADPAVGGENQAMETEIEEAAVTEPVGDVSEALPESAPTATGDIGGETAVDPTVEPVVAPAIEPSSEPDFESNGELTVESTPGLDDEVAPPIIVTALEDGNVTSEPPAVDSTAAAEQLETLSTTSVPTRTSLVVEANDESRKEEKDEENEAWGSVLGGDDDGGMSEHGSMEGGGKKGNTGELVTGASTDETGPVTAQSDGSVPEITAADPDKLAPGTGMSLASSSASYQRSTKASTIFDRTVSHWDSATDIAGLKGHSKADDHDIPESDAEGERSNYASNDVGENKEGTNSSPVVKVNESDDIDDDVDDGVNNDVDHIHESPPTINGRPTSLSPPSSSFVGLQRPFSFGPMSVGLGVGGLGRAAQLASGPSTRRLSDGHAKNGTPKEAAISDLSASVPSLPNQLAPRQPLQPLNADLTQNPAPSSEPEQLAVEVSTTPELSHQQLYEDSSLSTDQTTPRNSPKKRGHGSGIPSRHESPSPSPGRSPVRPTRDWDWDRPRFDPERLRQLQQIHSEVGRHSDRLGRTPSRHRHRHSRREYSPSRDRDIDRFRDRYREEDERRRTSRGHEERRPPGDQERVRDGDRDRERDRERDKHRKTRVRHHRQEGATSEVGPLASANTSVNGRNVPESLRTSIGGDRERRRRREHEYASEYGYSSVGHSSGYYRERGRDLESSRAELDRGSESGQGPEKDEKAKKKKKKKKSGKK